MLRDDRVRGLATEFAGNWLEFRRFEEHNGVDRERFASFTNELRQAMYEEPIRFFLDICAAGWLGARAPRRRSHVRQPDPGASTTACPIAERRPDEWVRVDDVRRYGRGGLLPMSVFLTANSPGLRTSPVKRGYWVVRRMLGETIPAAAAGGPRAAQGRGEARRADAAADSWPGTATTRSCAGCHQRFDSIGLVFEGYGPIGERRDRDLGGRPVDARATFPDGSEGAGLDGLRRYLSERRQDEFVDEPLPQAARLRARPQPAALGRCDHRGDARPALRRRIPLRRPDRDDRHQPAVPQ